MAELFIILSDLKEKHKSGNSWNHEIRYFLKKCWARMCNEAQTYLLIFTKIFEYLFELILCNILYSKLNSLFHALGIYI